jgi:hypothetical protein
MWRIYSRAITSSTVGNTPGCKWGSRTGMFPTSKISKKTTGPKDPYIILYYFWNARLAALASWGPRGGSLLRSSVIGVAARSTGGLVHVSRPTVFKSSLELPVARSSENTHIYQSKMNQFKALFYVCTLTRTSRSRNAINNYIT